MKTKGMSLKYKIMVLLTAVPLLLLASYLALVIKIFKDDKIAYVYDSNGSVNRSIAAQTRGIFAASLTTLKPVVQEYFSLGEFGYFSKQIFKQEPNLFLAAVLELKDGRLTVIDHIEKEETTYQDLIKQMEPLNLMVNNLGSDRRIVRTPFSDTRLLLIESLDELNSSEKRFIATIIRSPELEDLFSTGQSQRFALSTEGGDFLFRSGSRDNSTLSNFNNKYFKSVQSKTTSEGTELVKGKTQTFLASYNKIGFGNLMVSSMVDQDQALTATRVLFIRSLLFAGLLVSISLFISIFGSQSVTQALQELLAATRKIAAGDFTSRIKIKNKDEVGQLAESFNLMSTEISRLLEETAEKARMEGELRTAQTVQETLFPVNNATYEGVEIAGYYEPASECGGDWWYHKSINDKIILCIGDATGHGASAALITSAARSATSILEDLNLEPQHILKFLNKAIYDVSKGKVMMTFFLGIIDLKQGTFTYSNASHDPPFLVKASVSHPKKSDLIPLMEVVDPRLGQGPDSTYSQWTIALDEKDVLFFYTDGLSEVRNSQNDAFGERQFNRLVVEAMKERSQAQRVTNHCVSSLADFRDNSPLVDDLTFFCVKYGRAS